MKGKKRRVHLQNLKLEVHTRRGEKRGCSCLAKFVSLNLAPVLALRQANPAFASLNLESYCLSHIFLSLEIAVN